ncbi:MAG: hypothetical protein K2M78_08355 [Lachnospiraceae bacterium]|nr:hypothetical protein [Lachnospiraceae bacterium]
MIISLIIIWLFWSVIMGIYIKAGQSFYLCLFPLIICSGISIALSYISDYLSIGFALLLTYYFFCDFFKTNKSSYDDGKENNYEDDKHED